MILGIRRTSAAGYLSVIVLPVLCLTMACRRSSSSRSTSPAATLSADVVITAPTDGFVSTDPEVDIVGSITANDGRSVEGILITALGLRTETNAAGAFAFPAFALLDGALTLQIRAHANGMEIGTGQVTIHYAPSIASALIDPATGGVLEVLDINSPLFELTLSVPPSALTEPTTVKAHLNVDQYSGLPYGYVAVGPAAVLSPLALDFLASTTLRLPVDPNLFPAGTDINSVELFAEGDTGWEKLPISQTMQSTIETSLDGLAYFAFLPAIYSPLQAGEFRVDSSPQNATLYLDSADSALRTPLTLTNVDTGPHEIKLYMPGYNEVFSTIDLSSGGLHVNISLPPPGSGVPLITLDPHLYDGVVVGEQDFVISGHVAHSGVPQNGGVAVISLNGADRLTPINALGEFRDTVGLRVGHNSIHVRANSQSLDADTGISETIDVVFSRIYRARSRLRSVFQRDKGS